MCPAQPSSAGIYLVVPAGKLRVAEEDVVRGEEGGRYGLGHVKSEPLEGVHLPRTTTTVDFHDVVTVQRKRIGMRSWHHLHKSKERDFLFKAKLIDAVTSAFSEVW